MNLNLWQKSPGSWAKVCAVLPAWLSMWFSEVSGSLWWCVSVVSVAEMLVKVSYDHQSNGGVDLCRPGSTNSGPPKFSRQHWLPIRELPFSSMEAEWYTPAHTQPIFFCWQQAQHTAVKRRRGKGTWNHSSVWTVGLGVFGAYSGTVRHLSFCSCWAEELSFIGASAEDPPPPPWALWLVLPMISPRSTFLGEPALGGCNSHTPNPILTKLGR